MSIAQAVKETIEREQLVTFSLYAGYGLKNGAYVRFQGGRQEKERRNEAGRCTYALCRYADNSALEFKWSESNGFRLSVKAKGE